MGTYSVAVSNGAGFVANAAAVLRVIPVSPPDVTLTTLYSFKNGSDGANPNGLVLASDGNLYGTANVGANGSGSVFRITTNGVLTTLHAFTGGNDGSGPRAALIQGTDGNLYGTTVNGGANGNGTVFKIGLNGVLSSLHAFDGASEGWLTLGTLVQGSNGNFYGTMFGGGGFGSGTLFRLTPSGALTTLHSFNGDDGANPPTGLMQGKDGNFYGVTMNGGASAVAGTVFKVTPAGTMTTLVRFDRTTGWFLNAGLVQGKDGNFYGATINGGAGGHGTVFKISPTGLLTTLHSFNGASDGEWPDHALVEGKDGYFYGTTSYGGPYGDGTVFRMTPGGELTTLVQFDGFNGATPSGTLVQSPDGSFYGATLNGGANGEGTIFRLTVPESSLSIALTDGQIILAWPSWASDLVLQQTSDLARGEWSVMTNSPVVTNLQNQIRLPPAANAASFFRLAH